MNNSSIYAGQVVHKRLSPTAHALRYRVFTCLFDCDEIDALAARLTLFSRNRFNLVSLHDRDHAEDGQTLEDHLGTITEKAGYSGTVRRFKMMCYPRVLGYVFNPLTVYYGLDAAGLPRLMIYEVRNTFNERMSYVLPVAKNACARGVVTQHCRKQFYVSPFNSVEGDYLFHCTLPGERATLGVALKTDQTALLKAYFTGERREFTDRALLRVVLATGWLTAKVTAGIHLEALKLWLKGLRVRKRPAPPEQTIVFHDVRQEAD